MSEIANPSEESENTDADADKKILEDALARFKLAEEAESENRRHALDDIKFAAGDQWDQQIKSDREQDRRPCLTINRLPQHIKQITNDGRQNKPSIKVHPVDDDADIETAKVLSGLVRHIEYNSNADFAYDTAFETAVRGGVGYLRVITDYTSPLSFDQEVLIKRVRNPFSVFLDPFSQEPDGSDLNWGFITDKLPKEEYTRQFPNSKLAQNDEWNSLGNEEPDWVGQNGARIAEYFYKDFKEATIVLLNDGQAFLKDGLPQKLPDGVVVVSERKTQLPVIRWCKLNACEVLAKTDWLGSYIPIIPVYGEELDINGKRVLKGIVRDAKDPQRMLNFWKSAETEAIALAPKAPYLVEEGQIAGYEADWESANRRNHAYLKYKAKSVNGQALPLPQRQAFEPAVMAITQAAMQAGDDIKSTTGIYDSALGAQSRETSGVAIQRRNVQTQTSNFHFVDNLARSIRHTGRILVDLIPKVYDTARTVRIIGEDEAQEVVKVNAAFEKDGKPVIYRLTAGKYDVTVDVGPSYASKRQEAVASMMEIARAVPQIVQIAGDIMIRSMDWPGAQEIAERLKKTLPPNLTSDPKTQNDIPPEVQNKMQQMGSMIDQLTKHLHAAQDDLDQKKLELESKERIAMTQVQAQVEIALAKIGSQESVEMLRQEVAQIEQRLKLLRFDQPIEDESQEMPQQPSGALGAEMGQTAPSPTGGESPGLPMGGN